MVSFKLNGQSVTSRAPQATPLLNVLDQDFHINGSKFGCGKTQCGACLVLVDGNPVHACAAPLSAVAGRAVTTLEGMGKGNRPSKLQQAFIDEQAAQCGYCQPSPQAVRDALSGNLCRCGTHIEILAAVERAVAALSPLSPTQPTNA